MPWPEKTLDYAGKTADKRRIFAPHLAMLARESAFTLRFTLVHNPVLAFQQADRHVEPMNDDFPTRLPWPSNFPEVIIHTDVRSRDGHPGYVAAKSGDADAGLILAADLLSPDGLARIQALVAGRSTLLLPVVADELTGFNAIPDAMAQVLGSKLGLPVIQQSRPYPRPGISATGHPGDVRGAGATGCKLCARGRSRRSWRHAR